MNIPAQATLLTAWQQPFPDAVLNERKQQLAQLLAGPERLFIALSGGMDSSFLLLAAVLSRPAGTTTAVTMESVLTPSAERTAAADLCRALHIAHLIHPLDHLAIPAVATNAPDRCYHCKQHIMRIMKTTAHTHSAILIEGTNADDRYEERPGMRALVELNIASPLQQCTLGKKHLRALLTHLNCPELIRPASPCLATRFPTGFHLNAELAARVDQAETYLHTLLPATPLRVRTNGTDAVVTLPPATANSLSPADREQIVSRLKSLSFITITFAADSRPLFEKAT